MRADSNPIAPQFTVRTLDGQLFSNSSGSVILLQFWATWCPHCREDQAALDNVAAEFADQGLAVLAVNVGEPEETVKNYLRTNPRSCPIALDPSSSLASRFGAANSFPHYILIDQNGRIVGTQRGAGGEQNLLYLLGRAGLSRRSNAQQARNQTTSAPASPSSPQWIKVPGAQRTSSAKPPVKTVFVFTSGEQLEADTYVLQSGFLEVSVGGKQQSIPFSALDIKKTTALNHERGIDLRFPTGGNEVFLSF